MDKKSETMFFGILININMPGFTINDVWYNLKLSFKSFRKLFFDVWWFRSNDGDSSLRLMLVTFKEHLRSLDEDIYIVESEIVETKITLKRGITIIENILEDNYLERCDFDFNYDIWFVDLEDKPGFSEMIDNKTDEQKNHNDVATLKAEELEDSEWKELGEIISNKKTGLRSWWT